MPPTDVNMTNGKTLLRLPHHPRPRPRKRLPSAYDLAKVWFFLNGFPKNAYGSIDVSKDCNLRCKHCYFFEEEHPSELSIDEWIAKLEELRRTQSPRDFPFFCCTWVGGEPLIRKELIERGRKYFRHNVVVTNGTIPLPDWPDVNWYVSIDGDEELHEWIRNKKGIYRKAMRNVQEHPDLSVTVAYCITRQNAHCIEQVVKDWNEAGARHITFDFYTPIETIDDDLWPRFEERDRIIDLLIELRRVYGDFFVVPERVFNLMRSGNCRQVTDNCLFSRSAFAFGPDGESKGKCMMGEKADCDRCGCVVPFYMWGLTDRRRVVTDLQREFTHAARRAAAGVLTAITG